MVEAATGLIFVAIGQYAASLPMVIGGWWFAGSLIALALIDLDHFVLPDTLTLPLIPLGLGIRYLSGSPPSAVWLVDVLAVPLLLLGVRALYLRLRGIEGLGLGDVKLMASIGALMGVSGAIGALLVGSTLAAVAGLSAVALGRAGLRSRLPFGPFLIFGAMAWQAAIWAGALPPGLGPGL
jgi:leader peptidase (prepilin peptidase)/N-methyltransferase